MVYYMGAEQLLWYIIWGHSNSYGILYGGRATLMVYYMGAEQRLWYYMGAYYSGY